MSSLIRTSSAAERERRLALERETAMVAQQTGADAEELERTNSELEALRKSQGRWTFGGAVTELKFGDELSHPITVTAARFEVTGLPALGTALVKAALTVSNQHVRGEVKASLRFPLPDNAAVCGYSFQTETGMISHRR